MVVECAVGLFGEWRTRLNGRKVELFAETVRWKAS